MWKLTCFEIIVGTRVYHQLIGKCLINAETGTSQVLARNLSSNPANRELGRILSIHSAVCEVRRKFRWLFQLRVFGFRGD